MDNRKNNKLDNTKNKYNNGDSIIEDDRNQLQFKNKLFNGKSCSTAYRNILHEINNERPINVIYWLYMLLFANHYDILLEYILTLAIKHINNINLPLYFANKIVDKKLFRIAKDTDITDINEITPLRNDSRVRNFICESATILCNSPKYTIPSININKINIPLKDIKISRIENVFMLDDPRAIREICHNLAYTIETKNIVGALYMAELMAKYNDTAKPIAVRYMPRVPHKYGSSYMILIWKILQLYACEPLQYIYKLFLYYINQTSVNNKMLKLFTTWGLLHVIIRYNNVAINNSLIYKNCMLSNVIAIDIKKKYEIKINRYNLELTI